MRIAQSDGPISSDAVFGEEKHISWSRKIIERALRAEVIERLPKVNPRERAFYRATPKLMDVVLDDERLSNMIWPEPGLDPAPMVEDAHSHRKISERKTKESERPTLEEATREYFRIVNGEGEAHTTEASAQEKDDDSPDKTQMLNGLVRMTAAILENVVCTRKKIEAIETRLLEIEEVWK